jgi:hypothetical protein
VNTPMATNVAFVRWSWSLDLDDRGRLLATTYQKQPDCPDHQRRYHACRYEPDELAAFHDEIQNEVKVGKQLFLLALEDLTTYQPSLF